MGSDPDPPALAEAGRYRTARDGFEHGLVILAMGRPYWLMPCEDGYRLMVEDADLPEAVRQLGCFERESAGWPPAPPPREAPARGLDLGTPLAWAAAVIAVFWAQGRWPGRWERLGDLDSQAVFGRGEWWRLATALFLHADLGHLVSNLAAGVFIFAAVLAAFGRRTGWLLLGLASLAGNFGAVLLHRSEAYSSLGASTAVFAGLGLLTGRAVRNDLRSGVRHRHREVLAPLAAGAALLALYGAGGPEVDVGAHAAGFAAGLVLGFAAFRARQNAPGVDSMCR